MSFFNTIKNAYKRLVGSAVETSSEVKFYKPLWVDLGELIAETYATEEFGKGVYFESENKELVKRFLKLASKNKFDQILWRLIKSKNENGEAILRFDVLNNDLDDIKIELISEFSATKAYNDLIQVELRHQPIKMIGERNSYYVIKEFWTEKTLRRFFFYHTKILSFSTWAEKIDKKYQFDLSYGFAEQKTKKGESSYIRKNPFKAIPMQVFENIDQKADLTQKNSWNEYFNSIINEIRYDLAVSRPFFQISTIDDNLKKYIAESGLPKGIFLTTKLAAVNQQTKFQSVFAPNRIAILQQQIEMILKLAFNSANSSYATQLERVPARAEELANSKGGRTVLIKQKIIENDLKGFFQKIFKLWKIDSDFSIKLIPNSGSSAQNIEENIRKTAFGLTDKIRATAEVENVDQIKAEKIQKQVKKDQKEDFENTQKTEISAQGKIPNVTNSKEKQNVK